MWEWVVVPCIVSLRWSCSEALSPVRPIYDLGESLRMSGYSNLHRTSMKERSGLNYRLRCFRVARGYYEYESEKRQELVRWMTMYTADFIDLHNALKVGSKSPSRLCKESRRAREECWELIECDCWQLSPFCIRRVHHFLFGKFRLMPDSSYQLRFTLTRRYIWSARADRMRTKAYLSFVLQDLFNLFDTCREIDSFTQRR